MGKPPPMSCLEEIRKLIALPSVTGQEKEFALYLESRFRDMGCVVRLHEAAEERFNVYAVIEGRSSGRPGLLFHGHLDTVPPHGMEDPFVPSVRQGRVYGRGSVDQKGGIAAVIGAFEAFLSEGKVPEKPVAFIGVIDEESEHRGSMALRQMGVDADFAVVTEPTGLKVGIGCKGTAPIRVTVRGKAAHGCRPWLGKNAVLAGMDLTRMFMEQELPVCRIDGIGEVRASLNLGKIDGGRAYNIVADTCSIWFDRRLVPGETQEKVLETFRNTLAAYIPPEGVTASIEIARPDWNWEPIKKRGLLPALTDMSSPSFDLIQEAHRLSTGDEPVLFFTDGYQEMDFLVNDLGINAVQYGPGDSSLCHTDNEYLDLDQLESCARTYLGMMKLLSV